MLSELNNQIQGVGLQWDSCSLVTKTVLTTAALVWIYTGPQIVRLSHPLLGKVVRFSPALLAGGVWSAWAYTKAFPPRGLGDGRKEVYDALVKAFRAKQETEA